MSSGRGLARQHQEESPFGVAGILVASDSRAACVMRFALESGLKIPQHLRIGSFDDLPSAARLYSARDELTRPDLATAGLNVPKSEDRSAIAHSEGLL